MTVLMAVMVVGVVAAVLAYPLFRPAPMSMGGPVGSAAKIAALEERKLQIYAAIREIGFDFRTDKLEQQDYEEEVEGLKSEAVLVMKEIDELRQQQPRGPEALEQEIARLRSRPSGDATATAADGSSPAAAVFCTQCGTAARAGDRFCSGCGSPMRHA